MTIWTFSINLDTLEQESDQHEYDNYDSEYLEYADVDNSDDGTFVYAESAISAQKSKDIALEYCITSTAIFLRAAQSLYDEV